LGRARARSNYELAEEYGLELNATSCAASSSSCWPTMISTGTEICERNGSQSATALYRAAGADTNALTTGATS
jgi:hypothetical protein